MKTSQAKPLLQIKKHTIRNTCSVVKKQRKKKNNKKLLNLRKTDVSNKVKDVITSVQNNKRKKQFENKLAVKREQTEKSNISRKDSKADKKIQTNADDKVKRKGMKKQNVSTISYSNHTDNNASKVNVIELEKMTAKQETNFQQNKISVMMEIDEEPKLFQKILKVKEHKIKLNRLKELLSNKQLEKKQNNYEMKKEQPLALKDRMITHLKTSRFRFINETLYNNESAQSRQYFKEDPDAFKAYHDGYKQQLEQWPINPLDIIISSIQKMPATNIIADLGCGEARLATSVPHKVHSFDFIALNNEVQACDMAHTPLLTNSVHVVVFCLSLMGSNLSDYIIEANRILKDNGILKIAEVESRFKNLKDFLKLLCKYGFKNTWKDLSNDLFYFMDFKKEKDISMERNLPPILLKSCLYKKR